jgi:mRNA-degrading endonuclease RelE of RelBE toxin-antitoxin system
MSEAYEVFLEPRAEKELDKVPAVLLKRIDKVILALAKNPRPFGAKKIDQTIHRIRIGDWRVLFAILDDKAQVIILRIVRRNEKTYK